jgi:hypothetical protein
MQRIGMPSPQGCGRGASLPIAIAFFERMEVRGRSSDDL